MAAVDPGSYQICLELALHLPLGRGVLAEVLSQLRVLTHYNPGPCLRGVYWAMGGSIHHHEIEMAKEATQWAQTTPLCSLGQRQDRSKEREFGPAGAAETLAAFGNCTLGKALVTTRTRQTVAVKHIGASLLSETRKGGLTPAPKLYVCGAGSQREKGNPTKTQCKEAVTPLPKNSPRGGIVVEKLARGVTCAELEEYQHLKLAIGWRADPGLTRGKKWNRAARNRATAAGKQAQATAGNAPPTLGEQYYAQYKGAFLRRFRCDGKGIDPDLERHLRGRKLVNCAGVAIYKALGVKTCIQSFLEIVDTANRAHAQINWELMGSPTPLGPLIGWTQRCARGGDNGLPFVVMCMAHEQWIRKGRKIFRLFSMAKTAETVDYEVIEYNTSGWTRNQQKDSANAPCMVFCDNVGEEAHWLVAQRPRRSKATKPVKVEQPLLGLNCLNMYSVLTYDEGGSDEETQDIDTTPMARPQQKQKGKEPENKLLAEAIELARVAREECVESDDEDLAVSEAATAGPSSSVALPSAAGSSAPTPTPTTNPTPKPPTKGKQPAASGSTPDAPPPAPFNENFQVRRLRAYYEIAEQPKPEAVKRRLRSPPRPRCEGPDSDEEEGQIPPTTVPAGKAAAVPEVKVSRPTAATTVSYNGKEWADGVDAELLRMELLARDKTHGLEDQAVLQPADLSKIQAYVNLREGLRVIVPVDNEPVRPENVPLPPSPQNPPHEWEPCGETTRSEPEKDRECTEAPIRRVKSYNDLADLAIGDADDEFSDTPELEESSGSDDDDENIEFIRTFRSYPRDPNLPITAAATEEPEQCEVPEKPFWQRCLDFLGIGTAGDDAAATTWCDASFGEPEVTPAAASAHGRVLAWCTDAELNAILAPQEELGLATEPLPDGLWVVHPELQNFEDPTVDDDFDVMHPVAPEEYPFKPPHSLLSPITQEPCTGVATPSLSFVTEPSLCGAACVVEARPVLEVPAEAVSVPDPVEVKATTRIGVTADEATSSTDPILSFVAPLALPTLPPPVVPGAPPPIIPVVDLTPFVGGYFSFVASVTNAPRNEQPWSVRQYAVEHNTAAALGVYGGRVITPHVLEYGIGLVELHPRLNTEDTRYFRKNNWYYVDEDATVSVSEHGYLNNGQYNPLQITTISIGRSTYALEPVANGHGKMWYVLRFLRVVREATCIDGITDIFVPVSMTLEGIAETIRMRKPDIAVVTMRQPVVPDELRGSQLPGLDKAQWVALTSNLPPHLRPLMGQLRTANPSMPNGVTVEDMAYAAQLVGERARAVLQLQRQQAKPDKWVNKCGYSLKARNPKCCASCGNPPPEGPYKWPQRVCEACWEPLTKTPLEGGGYITEMGYHIQQNYTAATGYPGRVHVASDYLPPKVSKWQLTDVPDGSIRVKPFVMPWRKPVTDPKTKKKWVHVEPNDLLRMHEDLEPDYWDLVLAGIGVAGCRPRVSKKCVRTQLQALIGRAFLKKPPHVPKAWKNLMAIKKHILPDLRAEVMTVTDWVKSMPARRRRKLLAAYEEVQLHGLNKRDLEFQAFVKKEALASFKAAGYSETEAEAMAEAVARMIMAPMDKAHIIAGPILKPKVDRLKEHWHYLNWIFYGSAKPEVLQAWLDRWSVEEVFAFWSDFSMFDCTHSKPSIKCVNSYYEEMRTNADFRRVMTAWMKPKGRIGDIKFQAGIMLPSGTDDTALKNAVTNGLPTAIAIAAALCKVRTWQVTKEHLDFASTVCGFSVTGDDTLGFLPLSYWPDRERLMSEIERNLREFGFVPKLDCSDYLGHAVYLGQRPYNVPFGDGRKWVWGRTIGRALYKNGWMVGLEKGDPMAWVTGVAEQVALTQSHVPLLGDIAKRILRLREGCKVRRQDADPNRPWTDGRTNTQYHDLPYDETTVEALLECYNRSTYCEQKAGYTRTSVPTAAQVASCVEAIEGVSALPCNLDEMVLRYLCLHDDN